MAKARQVQDVRGRVVLRMRGGAASPLIVEAAVRVARAFRGELHGVFVEDEELLSLAGFPFAREVFLGGGRTRPLSPETMRREMEAARLSMAREFERLARAAHISARFEVFRGVAQDALREAMQKTGILALGEPLTLAGGEPFSALQAELSGLAGVVVAGTQARRAQGSILAVLDPSADIAQLVDTAERIAEESSQEIILVIAASTADEAAQIETEARQALDAGTRYRFERVREITPRTLHALVQQNNGGLLIAHADGAVSRDALAVSRLACALDCPLLLLLG